MTPGFIESEMTQGEFLKNEDQIEVDQDMRDVITLPPNLTAFASACPCIKPI